jgi:hypothetical protein
VPVHIDQMSSEVTVLDGDLPLTPEQIDKLVRIIMRRLDERERERCRRKDATKLHSSAAPSARARE